MSDGILINDGAGARGVTETTSMNLEEFCSWARGHPVLPDDGETKDEVRLGWNPGFEAHFRSFVAKTAGGVVEVQRLSEIEDVGKHKRTVKAWLQDCFRAIYSTKPGRELDKGLRRMAPNKQAAAAVAQSQQYGPVGRPTRFMSGSKDLLSSDSSLILPSHFRR
jgi:hypothetical protein